MTDYLRLVITPEDRERGRTRMIEEAWPVIREHYFGALAKNERATIRITLTVEPARTSDRTHAGFSSARD